ncbi:hypothetical protein [Streptomyces djakartensis]|jgi:hypothetical protein|uniref:hypothetical protein n=1 Tax=Streptomyces djakartensis TaxID=68193 RepID=UPI0034DFF925
MTVAPALRAALVTVAVAGATLLGAQIAQADGPAVTTSGTAGVTTPQATPSPTASGDTNPWD